MEIFGPLPADRLGFLPGPLLVQGRDPKPGYSVSNCNLHSVSCLQGVEPEQLSRSVRWFVFRLRDLCQRVISQAEDFGPEEEEAGIV